LGPQPRGPRGDTGAHHTEAARFGGSGSFARCRSKALQPFGVPTRPRPRAFHPIGARRPLRKLLGKPDKNALRPADVAEAVDAFVVDDFVDQGRAELGGNTSPMPVVTVGGGSARVGAWQRQTRRS